MNRERTIAYWRSMIHDGDELSDDEILISWFEQLAANAGVSFQIWQLDRQIEEWERPYASQAFANFSGGMREALYF